MSSLALDRPRRRGVAGTAQVRERGGFDVLLRAVDRNAHRVAAEPALVVEQVTEERVAHGELDRHLVCPHAGTVSDGLVSLVAGGDAHLGQPALAGGVDYAQSCDAGQAGGIGERRAPLVAGDVGDADRGVREGEGPRADRARGEGEGGDAVLKGARHGLSADRERQGAGVDAGRRLVGGRRPRNGGVAHDSRDDDAIRANGEQAVVDPVPLGGELGSVRVERRELAQLGSVQVGAKTSAQHLARGERRAVGERDVLGQLDVGVRQAGDGKGAAGGARREGTVSVEGIAVREGRGVAFIEVVRGGEGRVARAKPHDRAVGAGPHGRNVLVPVPVRDTQVVEHLARSELDVTSSLGGGGQGDDVTKAREGRQRDGILLGKPHPCERASGLGTRNRVHRKPVREPQRAGPVSEVALRQLRRRDRLGALALLANEVEGVLAVEPRREVHAVGHGEAVRRVVGDVEGDLGRPLLRRRHGLGLGRARGLLARPRGGGRAGRLWRLGRLARLLLACLRGRALAGEVRKRDGGAGEGRREGKGKGKGKGERKGAPSEGAAPTDHPRHLP